MHPLGDGVATVIGPGGRELSSGERQLVAIARILLREPSLVILDEPAARIDPATEALVRGALAQLLRGRTGLVIAHRRTTLDLVNSVALLERGTIVERIPRSDLEAAAASRIAAFLEHGEMAFAAGFAGIIMATAVASARLRFHVANALRRGILEALLHRQPDAAQPSIGAALATARDDPPALAALVATAVDQISIVIFIAVALFIMARIDPLITVVAVAPVAVVLVVGQLTRRRVDRFRTRSRQAAAEATGFIVDVLSAWQTIQLGGAQQSAAGRLARLDAERGRWAIRDQLLDRSIRAAFAATSIVGSGLVLAVAAGAMRTGDFSVGDFALFAYYLTFLGEFSAEFGGLLLQYRKAQVSWRRIGRLSGVEQRSHWSDAARPARGGEPADAEERAVRGGVATSPDQSRPLAGSEPLRELQLKHLRVRRRADINLTLHAGELVAVTGRVGAGKTTLLKALLGLVPLESGTLLWNGVVVRDPGSWFRWPVCTYVPQEPHLFGVSIRENVKLEHSAESAGTEVQDPKVDTALQAAVLAPDVAAMPNGVATVVGAAGTKLSGGQRQRLVSARAFFHHAPLVVLDDPCSALDPATERDYLRQVRRLAREGALCVVSGTGKALLTAADRIVVLRDGTVEAIGTLPELLDTAEFSLLWKPDPGGE